MIHSPTDTLTIEPGLTLSEMAARFSSKVQACEYYGQSMARRHASPGNSCACCGLPCDAPPVALTWRANLHTTKTVLLSFLFSTLAILAHHLYSRWVIVEFTTFHRLCPHCRSRHRLRSGLVAIVHHLLFAVLMLLLFVTAPMVLLLFVTVFSVPEMRWFTLGGSVLGLALLGLVAWGFEGCRKWLIPRPLRPIGQFPFFLKRVADAR